MNNKTNKIIYKIVFKRTIDSPITNFKIIKIIISIKWILIIYIYKMMNYKTISSNK
jgi:hypothetical protein